MAKEKKKVDGVFEGGGVKGIALVGAAAEVEKAGYEWQNLAGTSSGSIIAALLAVGYTAADLKKELMKLDYKNFKDEGLLDKLGLLGKGLSIGFEYGIYEGQFVEEWIEELLRKKGVTKFGEIITGDNRPKYKYKFQAVVTDITDQQMLVLPGDLKGLGLDPDEFSISRAVRMSLSIPVFFEPVRLRDKKGRSHMMVDGGVLSNYPIWLLDSKSQNPSWPTFGFKHLGPRITEVGRSPGTGINSPVEYLKALVGTMLDGRDNYHVSKSRGDFQRTIGVPTEVKVGSKKVKIKATDFDITRAQKLALYANGQKAGRDFLKSWDFEKWVGCFRKKPPTRTDC